MGEDCDFAEADNNIIDGPLGAYRPNIIKDDPF